MTKVEILSGGMGTRLREETEYKPKPLVEIGGKPILWHIMNHYAHYGFNEFILCLGYKGEMIKNYFLNYKTQTNNVTISLKSGAVTLHDSATEDWHVTCVDTGEESLTGKRLKLIQPFIGEDDFFVTYGDGVSDVNIKDLFQFHKAKGKLGTITGIRPLSKYGSLKTNEESIINAFIEKPVLNDRINGGFFVFTPQIFSHLDENMFEFTTLPKLAEQQQLAMYQHDGFWQCMDTYRDYLHLNKLWQTEKPWKIWK